MNSKTLVTTSEDEASQAGELLAKLPSSLCMSIEARLHKVCGILDLRHPLNP